ncbi:Protein CBG16203 [Caenorhabditis briggsae]|uniref:Protein CBG16203 n=2 Tax=Caenorhabditis briggsae TaxID=6238 RepID=A8XNW4_CAEBR|nr:Protein CBG16203 [Caenorhabditis briggsae]ULT79927.1 hypothetical protein L3Y34_010491 [Caenorhabditis briggsae]CAP34204.1 Protein CBG16203 [Caenorhabditis briggsae]
MTEQENEPFQELQAVVEMSVICLIEGIADVLGIDKDAFTVKKLCSLMRDYQISVTRQIPEAPDINKLNVYDNT